MSDTTTTSENPTPETEAAPPAVTERVASACKIAADPRPCSGSARPAGTITAGKKDLNCKGRGPWWYRMVWRGGAWQYFSAERLPMGAFLASDRRASVSGEVYEGEIVVVHAKGAGLDEGGYLVCAPNSEGKVLHKIAWTKRRDGRLVFSLPDGSEVVTPNPRSR